MFLPIQKFYRAQHACILAGNPRIDSNSAEVFFHREQLSECSTPRRRQIPVEPTDFFWIWSDHRNILPDREKAAAVY